MPAMSAHSFNTPSRSPERDKLATAIANHAAITAALAENLQAQQRAEYAGYEANRSLVKAEAAIEDAHIADARALAAGEATSYLKAARTVGEDARAKLDSVHRAKSMLSDEHADLTNRLAIVGIDAAVRAVIEKSPEVQKLIANFKQAQQTLVALQDAMAAIGSAMPTENQGWNATNWLTWGKQNGQFPQTSQLGLTVQAWIRDLHENADAILDI